MRRARRGVLGLGAAVACALVLPSSAPAQATIDAVFFQEYSAPTFTIDQGELVTFQNRDPFLSHGLVSDDPPAGDPLFSAPVIHPGETRLVRGAPFLTTGTYDFHCPVHPEMTATLEVTANGAARPPDTRDPTASVTVGTGRLAKLLAKRRVRFSVDPSEAADVAIGVRAAGVGLTTAERTYLSPGPRTLGLRFTRTTLAELRSRIADLRERHR